MSLRELWNVRRAYKARVTEAHERDVVLAWNVERVSIMALERNGGRRLPDLGKLLGETGKKAPRKQTWQEMKAYMKAFSDAQAKAS